MTFMEIFWAAYAPLVIVMLSIVGRSAARALRGVPHHRRHSQRRYAGLASHA